MDEGGGDEAPFVVVNDGYYNYGQHPPLNGFCFCFLMGFFFYLSVTIKDKDRPKMHFFFPFFI